MLEPIASHTWPTDGLPFGGIAIRVADLATRLGLVLRAWQVDGLGPAHGFAFRVPSGRVYLAQELELEVRYYGARGPTLYADATELVSPGIKALVDEVAAELGLSAAEVIGLANSNIEQLAAKIVAAVADAKVERDSP
jgi:hypothetical protein